MLSITERSFLEEFPHNVSRENIIKFFTLSKKDLSIIPTHSNQCNRLGFALQLCSLRFLGFFPLCYKPATEDVLTFLASQLNIASLSLSNYGKQKNTKLSHQKIIIKHLKFEKFGADNKKNLINWITERSMEHEDTFYLTKLACEKLHIDRIIRPRISSIERIIGTAKKESWERTYSAISYIVKIEKESIDRLIDAKNGDLSWLRSTISKNTSNEILNTLEKIRFLKKLNVHNWDISNLNPNRAKYIFLLGKKLNKPDIRRLNKYKKYSVVTVFLIKLLEGLVDTVVEQFDRNLQDKITRAKNQLDKFRKKNAKNSNQIIHRYKEIISIIADDKIESINLRERRFSQKL